jgi:hypothetical protein
LASSLRARYSAIAAHRRKLGGDARAAARTGFRAHAGSIPIDEARRGGRGGFPAHAGVNSTKTTALATSPDESYPSVMRARRFKRVAIAVLWPLTVGSAWGLGFHMGLAWYLFDMRSLKQVSWTEMSTLCFRDPNEEFWLGCRDVREVVEVMAAQECLRARPSR